MTAIKVSDGRDEFLVPIVRANVDDCRHYRCMDGDVANADDGAHQKLI
jgi:hypothetical protein